jgi:hypothetical protein
MVEPNPKVLPSAGAVTATIGGWFPDTVRAAVAVVSFTTVVSAARDEVVAPPSFGA